MTGALIIGPDDPAAPDVRELLATHLNFARGTTPAEFSFAMDVDALLDPSVTFYSARQDGALLGVAALKRLDDSHVELKSMHVRAEARGRGVGKALVDHLVNEARSRGYSRISLETGTMEEFAAARRLYQRCGFTDCGAFGEYHESPYNTWMTLELV